MGQPRSGVTRTEAVFVVILVAVGALFAATSAGSPSSAPSNDVRTPECNSALRSQLGQSAKGLCVELVQISITPTNFSEITIPVIVMKPGSTATMEILYSIGSENQGHIGPKVTVRPNDTLLWMSVPSGNLTGKVLSSTGREILRTKTVLIYQYTITSSPDSTGYYALLPPYYAGTYPALYVGENPGELNMTTLSTWAYTGFTMTAENNVPSTVVGTGELGVVNVTLPDNPHCLNPACNLIAHALV